MRNLVGQRFGLLVVLKYAGRRYLSGTERKQWKCVCDCGGQVVRLQQELCRKGSSVQSCGCYLAKFQAEGSARRRHKHAEGRRPTRTYRSWQAMKGRCYREGDVNYGNYGGRGIRVCERWLRSFDSFLEDMGECPQGYSLERKNVDGNYEPDNCTWIPRNEQSGNRRCTHVVEFEGREWRVPELAKHLGISPRGVRRRIEAGKLISRKGF